MKREAISPIPLLCLPILFAVMFCSAEVARTQGSLDLAGVWQFQLDAADAGIRERWFDRTLPQQVRLPGALQAQGFGDEVSIDTKWTGDIIDRSYFTDPRMAKYREPGRIKLPFWLQPEK